MPLSQEGLQLKVTTPLGADKLVPLAIHGEERISGLFRYTLEMVSDDAELSFDSVVGEGATVTIGLASGGTRIIHGIVARFTQAGTGSRGTVYHAELVPKLWLATLAADCRIYQNQTAPQIIEALLDELTVTDRRNALTATYTAREYCVQYRETAFQFVTRLMEEEGIFYFFEHADGVHTLVLADDADAHAATPDLATARYSQTATSAELEDVVTQCTWERQVTTGKYTLDDFSFLTPSTNLAVTVEGAAGTMELFDYPGGFAATDAGERVAKLRLESYEATAKRLNGESTCRAMTAGFAFTLAGHGRAELNAEYVVLSLAMHATQKEYGNRFEAFPKATPFRAPLAARKPSIPGTQTALVVGKSGEEIWTDKYGRVKVQFHWDRKGTSDENSSCWVRVAQGWAGQGWGSVFIPRMGQEVVVSFLDGDPDRPLITGSVYNAEQTVPYTLPDDGTKSTVKSKASKAGTAYNELRFQDLKDSEEIFVHAGKDMKVEVVNDRTIDVQHDETHTVKNARTLTVSEGDQALTVTKGKRTVTVSEGDETLTVSKGKRTVDVSAGDEAHTVGGKRSVAVAGDETHDNSAKFTQSCTGDYTLNVTGNLVIKATGSVTIESQQGMKLKAAMSLAAEGLDATLKASTGLTLKGLNVDVAADAALTAKSNASTSVESSGITAVKGSLLKLN
ncbi:MAG TPA: type VI secretion system tip protein TssI/VgrG [Longimicrobium sp.]|nr:type VI secretion system tip protein TssI/VgrG [Longimicrobium sp.]